MSFKQEIEKLTHVNYGKWSFIVKAWATTENIDLEEPGEKDSKVAFFLATAVSDEVIPTISNLKTGKEMWEKLQETYAISTENQTFDLLVNLFSVTKGTNEKMNQYIARVKGLYNQVNNSAIKDEGRKCLLNDKLLVVAIVRGLPAELQGEFRRWEKSTLSLGAIENKLVAEEYCLTNYILQTTAKSGDKRKEKKELTCYWCKEKGHIKRDCVKFKNRKETNLAECFFSGRNQWNWVVDSGASFHIISNMDLIHEFEEYHEEILVANGSTMIAVGKGTVNLEIGGKFLMLKECLFIPEVSRNIISVSQLNNDNYQVYFSKNYCSIEKNGEKLNLTGDNGIFVFDSRPIAMLSVDKEIIHQRFGHPGRDASLKIGIEPIEVCKGCLEGEHSSKVFRKNKIMKNNTSKCLELLHMDICGPIPVSGIDGSRYILCIMDDFSRYSEVFFLIRKNEAVKKFVEYKAKYENMLNINILAIKTDNGGEFCSNEFVNYLETQGIEKRTITPYANQQNGKAERLNRTIMKKARALMFHNDSNVELWTYAVECANFLRNNTYSKAVNAIPSALFGLPQVDCKLFRVWGCKAYVRIPPETRNKLEKQSKQMIFIGYAPRQGGYKFLDPMTKKVTISCNAIFDEKHSITISEGNRVKIEKMFIEFLPQEMLTQIPKVAAQKEKEMPVERTNVNQQERVSNKITEQKEIVAETMNENYCKTRIDSDGDEILVGDSSDEEISLYQQFKRIEEGMDLGERKRKKIVKMNLLVSKVPASVKQAMESKNKKLWRSAMEEEMNSMIENEVWTLVDLPEGKKLTKTKWVFDEKKAADGSIERYKARLCAKGCSQDRKST